MKRTVSLFEFMPYGAPELLAAGRPHLARALFLSSLTPVLAFLALLPFVPMLRTVEIRRVEPPEPHRVLDPNPPSIIEPPDIVRAIMPSLPAKPAVVIPVEDPEFREPPPIEARGGPPNVPPGNGDAKTHEPSGPGSGPAVVELEPTRGDWIYTDELPQAVYEYKPDYPEFARQAGVEGLVVVHALIGKDGRVIRVEVDEKKSILLLNETAMQAALKWKFTPALANGHAITVWFAIPFKFVLHE